MKPPIGSEAKELLQEAKLVSGEIFVLETSPRGKWVRVGQRDYGNDAESRRRYRDALQDLIGAGFVEATGGVRYELTREGWDAAKEL